MTERCEVGEKLHIVYTCECNNVRRKGYYTTDPEQAVLKVWRALERHLLECDQCRKAESEAK